MIERQESGGTNSTPSCYNVRRLRERKRERKNRTERKNGERLQIEIITMVTITILV